MHSICFLLTQKDITLAGVTKNSKMIEGLKKQLDNIEEAINRNKIQARVEVESQKESSVSLNGKEEVCMK